MKLLNRWDLLRVLFAGVMLAYIAVTNSYNTIDYAVADANIIAYVASSQHVKAKH